MHGNDLQIQGNIEGDTIGFEKTFVKDPWQNGIVRKEDVFYGMPILELLGEKYVYSASNYSHVLYSFSFD